MTLSILRYLRLHATPSRRFSISGMIFCKIGGRVTKHVISPKVFIQDLPYLQVKTTWHVYRNVGTNIDIYIRHFWYVKQNMRHYFLGELLSCSTRQETEMPELVVHTLLEKNISWYEWLFNGISWPWYLSFQLYVFFGLIWFLAAALWPVT